MSIPKDTAFVPAYGTEEAIKKGAKVSGRLYFSPSGKIYLDTTSGRILIADKTQTFAFQQETESEIWVIEHNLNRYPVVTIIDNEGNELIGDVKYDSENQITIAFSEACSGKVFLN